MLMTFRTRATELQCRGSTATTISIGEQGTMDEEMMIEHKYQIETPTVCQSNGLNIDKDTTNIEKIRELTDTKTGRSYSDMRAMGPSTLDVKEEYDISSHEIIPIRFSRVPRIGHMLQHEESLTTVVDNE